MDELCALSDEDRKKAMDSMTLGEMLALTGMTIEVEREGADADENEALTRVVLDSRGK